MDPMRSPTKSINPGVSMKLSLWFFHSHGATVAYREILRLTSFGSKSETVLPSSTRPRRSVAPAVYSRASQRRRLGRGALMAVQANIPNLCRGVLFQRSLLSVLKTKRDAPNRPWYTWDGVEDQAGRGASFFPAFSAHSRCHFGTSNPCHELDLRAGRCSRGSLGSPGFFAEPLAI